MAPSLDDAAFFQAVQAMALWLAEAEDGRAYDKEITVPPAMAPGQCRCAQSITQQKAPARQQSIGPSGDTDSNSKGT